MIKILFLIHDLGQGGAEKVLVNLVNNMDRSKFDISVTTLFGGGVNEQFLKPHIHYSVIWKKGIPGNSKLMKLLTPRQLHQLCVKDKFDIEVSYLEGPSARVISGCEDKDTKLVSWIHSTMKSPKEASTSFRNYAEAVRCYEHYNKIICVSQGIKDSFENVFWKVKTTDILYNTIESTQIKKNALENTKECFDDNYINLIAVGSLKPVKGFDRLLRIHRRLSDDGFNLHTYILGKGQDMAKLEKLVKDLEIHDSVTFLGYHTNPYKYVAQCDLFVCASYAEGFSTAVSEALVVGTPVCTVEVAGMKEILGENNEYGIVTENDDNALYEGIKILIGDPKLLSYYKKRAAIRGEMFSTENTVRAVEEMLESL